MIGIYPVWFCNMISCVDPEFLHIIIFTFGIPNLFIWCCIEDNFCLSLLFSVFFFLFWDFIFAWCYHRCVARIKFPLWQFTVYCAKNYTYKIKLNKICYCWNKTPWCMWFLLTDPKLLVYLYPKPFLSHCRPPCTESVTLPCAENNLICRNGEEQNNKTIIIKHKIIQTIQ